MNMSQKIRPLKLSGEIVDVGECLGKDYPDIAEASEELPGLIEWINMERQGLVEKRLNLKFAVRRRSAEVFMALRQPGAWEEHGYTGKPTEKALEMAVELDEDRENLILKYNRTASWVLRLNTTLEALQTKLDLVRTVEATKRKTVRDTDLDDRRPKNHEEEDEEP